MFTVFLPVSGIISKLATSYLLLMYQSFLMIENTRNRNWVGKDTDTQNKGPCAERGEQKYNIFC